MITVSNITSAASPSVLICCGVSDLGLAQQLNRWLHESGVESAVHSEDEIPIPESKPLNVADLLASVSAPSPPPPKVPEKMEKGPTLSARVLIVIASAITERIKNVCLLAGQARDKGAFVLTVTTPDYGFNPQFRILLPQARTLPGVDLKSCPAPQAFDEILSQIREPLRASWEINAVLFVASSLSHYEPRINAILETTARSFVVPVLINIVAWDRNKKATQDLIPDKSDFVLAVLPRQDFPKLAPPFHEQISMEEDAPRLHSLRLVTVKGENDITASNLLVVLDNRLEETDDEVVQEDIQQANSFIEKWLLHEGRIAYRWHYDLHRPMEIFADLKDSIPRYIRACLDHLVRGVFPGEDIVNAAWNRDFDENNPPSMFSWTPNIEWLGRRTSLMEAEATMLLSHAGHQAEWRHFKRHIREGDEIWYYGHQQNPEGYRCSHSYLSGLCLVREGKVFAAMPSRSF